MTTMITIVLIVEFTKRRMVNTLELAFGDLVRTKSLFFLIVVVRLFIFILKIRTYIAKFLNKNRTIRIISVIVWRSVTTGSWTMKETLICYLMVIFIILRFYIVKIGRNKYIHCERIIIDWINIKVL